MVLVSILALFYEIKMKRHVPADLLVNRRAAEAAAQAENASREAEGGGDGGQA